MTAYKFSKGMGLIDALAASIRIDDKPNQKMFHEALPWITLDFCFQAKHFVLDAEAAKRLIGAYKQRNLLRQLREFAIPPFEKMTISLPMENRHEKMTVENLLVLDYSDGQHNIAWLYDNMASQDRTPGLYLEAASPMQKHRERVEQSQVDALQDMLDAFILILLGKRTTTVVEHPTKTMLRKGKRVRFYARSEITIDLNPMRGIKRIVASGERGSPRRHGVMGHFTHRGGRKHGCTHAWEPVEREDGKKRWECKHCGRLRTWKAAFERGDAGKGWVRQSYKVIG